MEQSTRADTIEVELFGGKRVIDVRVPQGESTLLDLLPAARAVADAVSEAAIEKARNENRRVSCSAGCAACCRQMVGISAVEAMGLARTVAGMPAERRAVIEGRFARAVERLEEAGLLEGGAARGERRIVGTEPGKSPESGREAAGKYFALGIACPFLEAESCSIYAERPLICREYNVTSPAEACATFRDPAVKKVSLPLYSGSPLARVAARVTGVSISTMPITLALEWAGAHQAAMGVKQEGEAMYNGWLASIDPAHDVPFDQRD